MLGGYKLTAVIASCALLFGQCVANAATTVPDKSGTAVVNNGVRVAQAAEGTQNAPAGTIIMQANGTDPDPQTNPDTAIDNIAPAVMALFGIGIAAGIAVSENHEAPSPGPASP